MQENRLHTGDARRLLEFIDPESVDAVITSPPYADLKDYGADGQIGFGQDYRCEYLPELEDIFRKCHAVAKPSCSLWVVVDTFKHRKKLVPLPFDLADRICKAGWSFRDVIVWDKGKTLPWSRKGQLRNVFEYVLFFTKSDEYKYRLQRITVPKPQDLKQWWVKYPERYNPEGKVPSNIWNFTIPTQGSWGRSVIRHFCPFPTELVERMLLLSTDEDDLVLDPFAGSGTVLAQAAAMRRRYIGIEINEDFREHFPEVMKEVIASHQAREAERALREQDQVRFRDLIWRLRMLKFPIHLLRRMNPTTAETVSSVVLVAHDPVPDSRKIRLVLAVRDTTLIEKVLAEATSNSSRAPLSKYGLETAIEAVSQDEARKIAGAMAAQESTWMYTSGRFWAFESRFLPTTSLATRNGTSEAPPMVSNVRAYQKSADKFDETDDLMPQVLHALAATSERQE